MNRVSDIRIESAAVFSEIGSLVALQANEAIPFPIERVFYVYGVDHGETRGKHAHKTCTQVLICLTGSCEVTCDDGLDKKNFVLNKPFQLLLIPVGIWSEIRYQTKETILMVLCDEKYDESEYIREYPEFLQYTAALRAPRPAAPSSPAHV